MPDNVLLVTTSVNLAPLQAGMQGAAQIVRDKTAQINQDFAGTAAATTTAARGMSTTLAGTVAATEEVGAGMSRMGAVTRTEAGHSTHALKGIEEMIGVRMPRFVNRYIGSLEGVAPIMSKAFSAVIVVMVAEALLKVVDKVIDLRDKLEGTDKASRKLWDGIIEGNQKAVQEMLHLNEEHLQLREKGLTGLALIHQKTVDATDAMRAYAAEGKEAARTLEVLREVKEQLEKEAPSAWYQEYNPLLVLTAHTYANEIEKVDERIKLLEGHLGALTKRMEGLRDEKMFKLPAESKEESNKEANRVQGERIAAQKRVADAIISGEEKATKEQYELGRISSEEETNQLLNAEQEKYEVTKTYLEKKRALMEAEAKTGKSVDRAGQDAAELAEETRHLTEMATLRSSLDKRSKDEARALAEARISAEEEVTRRLYAAHQIDAHLESAILQEEENKRYAIQVAAAGKDHDVLQRLEIEHQAKIAAIKAEGDQKQGEDELRWAQERLSSAEASANQELEFSKQMDSARLKAHQESTLQWAANERVAINRWYSEQVEAINDVLRVMRNADQEGTVAYQQMLEKMKQLDQKRVTETQAVNNQVEQKYRQMATRITDALNQNLQQWITGQVTFGQMMINIWNQAVTAVIMALVRQGEQMLISAILGKLISASTVIPTKAAEASAGAFSSVMVSTPFPANMALAPTMAAAAFAQVMAMAALETGSDFIPGTGVAMLHKREMVLNAPTGDAVRNFFSSNSSVAGGHHFAPVFHIHGASDPEAVMGHIERNMDRLITRVLRRTNRTP